MQLEKIASTPHSDRGVQNTRESGLEVLVDWVSCSFVFEPDPQKILDYLGLDIKDFHYTNLKFSCYDACLSSYDNTINIFYCTELAAKQNGSFLNMSGQGCRAFERLSVFNWKTLFYTLVGLGCNFTRLDIAIDDFNNTFTVKQIERKALNGEVVSKFKDNRDMRKIRLKDGKVKGHTSYFGSEHSELQIRFYDKKEERLDKHKIVNEEVETWVRTELQLRRERAKDFIEKFVYEEIELGLLACSVLKHYISFRVKDKNEPNKSRWKVAPFWDKFLKGVEPLRLVNKAKETSLIRTFNWLEKNVSKSLYLYVTSSPTGATELEQLLEKGKEQVKEKEMLLLEDLAINVYKKSFKQLQDEQKKYLSDNIHSKRFLNISKFQG